MIKKKRITENIVLLLFIFSVFIPQKTNREPKNLSDLTLEELLHIKVKVASKLNDRISLAPSSVIVFTKKDIQQMGVTSLEELLNFVPGFQVSKDVEQGNMYRISSRGRSTAISESILILLNGVRLNDLYTGGATILNRRITLNNVKQIEIIRGPGSALYGSNAFLGVINIITEIQKTSISTHLGNLGQKAMSINFSRRIDSVSVKSSLSFFRDNGYQFKNLSDIWNRILDSTDPVSGLDVNFNLTYKKFTLDFRHMERRHEGFLTFGTLSENHNREETRQSYIHFKHSDKFTKRLSYTTNLSYTEDYWKVISLGIPKDTEIAPDFFVTENVLLGPHLTSSNIKLAFDFNFKISMNTNLLWGISNTSARTTHVAHLFSHHPISLDYEGEVTEHTSDSTNFNVLETRNIFGIYAHGRHRFYQTLHLTVGARLDHYSDFGTTINPRSAIVYETPINSYIKLMFGKAFRAPNFLELYDKNNPVDFGNPDLVAEEVETIEFAYTQDFKFLHFTVTLFKNNIKNRIVFGQIKEHPLNPLGAPSFENDKSLWHSDGIEVNANSKIFKYIDLKTSYTRYFERDIHVPKISGSWILNYKHQWFNLNLNAIYKSSVSAIKIPSYTRLNVSSSIYMTKKEIISFTVKNVFDTQLYHYSDMFIKNGVPERGRTFTLNYQFGF